MMKKLPSYEELQARVSNLEKKLQNLKQDYSEIPFNINPLLFFEICEYSKNAIALFESNNGESFFIRYFNKKAEEFENVKREDIVGKNLNDVFPSINVSGFLDALKRVFKSNTPEEFPAVAFSSGKILEWKQNYIFKLSENEIVSIYIDETSIKNKEYELKEHQEKLHIAMEAASYFSFEINLKTYNISTQKEIYLALGYNTEDSEGLLKKTGSLIHPEDYKKAKKLISKHARGIKAALNFEFRAKNKIGKWIWFNATGRIIDWDKDSKPLKLVGLLRVVQEEKEILLKLQESESRLKLAMESANQALIDWNIKEDIIYYSPEWYKMFEYNPGEVVINYDFTVQIAHPDDVPSAEQKLQDHINGKTDFFDAEVRMKTKSGKWKWILTHGKIVQRDLDGNPLRAIGIQTDITSIKSSELKLKESEENFRQLSENINDAFWLRSLEHEVIYANPACYKIVGKRFKEIFEDFESYKNWIHPDDREKIINQRRNNLKYPYKIHYYEHRVIKPDGDIRWLWIRTFPVFDNHGKLYRRAGIASDISEQKRLLSDFVIAKEKAEESDKLKSAFLANMSHEIRTPMNGILGFAELLKDEGINEQEKHDYLKIIDSNGKQLLNLINDIIDVAKIEAGQLSINKTIFEINPVLEEMYQFFFEEQRRLKKQKIKFNLNIPAGINNTIFTDESRIKQVFNNLLSNAFRFTESGTINFGYSLINNQNESYYQFFVSDTGIGISKNMQNIIFERFGQIEPKKQNNRQGTGLGLAISKGLIELLNGKIWFESTPQDLSNEIKGGSIFYFTIPVSHITSSNEQEKNEIKASEEMKNLENVHILVVEDDNDNLELLRRFLIKYGAQVIVARSGKEAIEAVKSNNHIKVVLMDIRLPDINGFDTTQQIKAINPNLPVIAQTAYAMYNDRELCLENGCDDYMSKPLDKDILYQKINHYIYN